MRTQQKRSKGATYTGVSSKSAFFVEVDAKLNLRIPLSVMKQLAHEKNDNKKTKNKYASAMHARPRTESQNGTNKYVNGMSSRTWNRASALSER